MVPLTRSIRGTIRCLTRTTLGGIKVENEVNTQPHSHPQKCMGLWDFTSFGLKITVKEPQMYGILGFHQPCAQDHCEILFPSKMYNKIAKILPTVSRFFSVCFCDFNEVIMANTVCNVKSMFSSHNLVQHIETPTRDSGTLINHVCTTNIEKEKVNCGVCDCSYHDHDIIIKV